MIRNPEILKAFQRVLEDPLEAYLTRKYPEEMRVYMRFRRTTGPQCNFCKASARLIFRQEAAANNKFLNDFINNDWANGYQ